jgi:hypothetical protein
MALVCYYHNQRKQALLYCVCVTPLILFFLFNPLIFNQVFLYQFSNKVMMSDQAKLLTALEFLGINIFLVKGLIKNPEINSLIITLVLFIGVFLQKTVYLMYIALLLPFLVLTSLSGKSKNDLLWVVLFTIILSYVYVEYTDFKGTIITTSEIDYLTNLSLSYNVSLAGDMNVANLISYHTRLPMACDVFDTSYWNVGLVDTGYFDCIKGVPHLFVCYERVGFHSSCELINKSDYSLIGSFRGMNLLYNNL